MNWPWQKLHGPAKVLIVFVAILLISAGLCGIQLLILNGANGKAQLVASLFMITGVIELAAMAISLVGVIVTGLIWIVLAIVNRGDAPGSQKLFDDEDRPRR